MMALPFLTLAGAVLAAAFGRRDWSLAGWGLTAVLLLALFAAHATDPLDLQF